MNNPVYELKNARNARLEAARVAMTAHDQEAWDQAMAEVDRLNGEIDQHERLQAEAGRFDSGDTRMAALAENLERRKEEELVVSRADKARSGNEYMRAFLGMVRDGVSVRGGRKQEEYAPLYAALTETGGTPEGADGGFLVPIDFDNRIHEVRRALRPLAEVFTLELVNTLTGWRVMDNAPNTGFELVAEMGQVPIRDQPSFRKIDYHVQKYGQIVPLSRELADDNAAELIGYLARWFGKKSVITENKKLLELLAQLTPTAVVAGAEVQMIKNAINVTLDPAISASAVLLTNQNGFSALDELEDTTGRPLLQPDVTNPTTHRLFGRRVVVMPRSVLPNAGANEAPLYIGDFTQYGTLFRRKAFELAATDIGGEAWRTDSIETRGLMRLDARVFDTEAAVALTLSI